MTTVVVVQARVASTRLAGKVLLPVCGKPMLERQLERIRGARSQFELCVATTTAAEDEPIRQLCRRLGVPSFDGHPQDLLDRHYRVALAHGADVVVKIPSDCPLIDPAAIDAVLGHFEAQRGRFDFVTNLYPPSWPDGNDVEVMTFDALEVAFRSATRPFEREHTTPYIWERPERFRIGNVRWETGLDFSASHRFTVDYAGDLALVRRVYRELWTAQRPVFSLQEILALLEEEPAIALLNASYRGQSWHLAHADELRSVERAGSIVKWRTR